MKNIMKIDGYEAVICYRDETNDFRGEFIGLNGGADFYAADVEGLIREGRISLQVFLEFCEKEGIAPRKSYSGKFMLRLDPELHARAVSVAAADGCSLNELVERAVTASLEGVA